MHSLRALYISAKLMDLESCGIQQGIKEFFLGSIAVSGDNRSDQKREERIGNHEILWAYSVFEFARMDDLKKAASRGSQSASQI